MTLLFQMRACVAALAVAAPALVSADVAEAKTSDLSGVWGFYNGTRITLTQTGNKVVGVMTFASNHNVRNYAYTDGMTFIRGTVQGNKLVGKLRSHFPAKWKKRCPKNWFVWTKLELSLSKDGRALKGGFQGHHIDLLCKVLPSSGREDLALYSVDRPEPLPADGLVKAKGRLGKTKGRYKGVTECSCKTVRLARVKVEKLEVTYELVPPKRISTYHNRVTRNLDYRRPPTAGNRFTIPELRQDMRMRIFFTFPERFAYWGVEARNRSHPCNVAVEIKYPFSHSPTGHMQNVWQLYAIRAGVYRGSFGGQNDVALSNSDPVRYIKAGRGHIKWNVNGRTCPRADYRVVKG